MVKRDFLVLMIAAICGFAAFVLIFNFLKEATQPKRAFVVSTGTIPQSKMITAEDIAYSKPVKNMNARDHFLQADDVKGRIALEEIPANTLISRSKVELPKPEVVASVEQGLKIPQGKTALTISRNDILNLNNELRSGQYVDLVGVLGDIRRGAKPETVVSSAIVASVERSNDNKTIESMTIAASPEEVQSIMNASSLGKLRMAVRSTPASEGRVVQEMEVIRGVTVDKKVKFE